MIYLYIQSYLTWNLFWTIEGVNEFVKNIGNAFKKLFTDEKIVKNQETSQNSSSEDLKNKKVFTYNDMSKNSNHNLNEASKQSSNDATQVSDSSKGN